MAVRKKVRRTAPVIDRGQILTGNQLAKFTALTALFAILADAAVSHGLTWENDPYWTYWITKTFLIATVFGVGTALIGIGRLRGAIIAAVHTLILTIYYWTFSPIGLPSSPTWLDLEHTWLTGLPIHFGVIYLGYLTALWLWRNRSAEFLEPRTLAIQALMAGVLITLVSGLLTSLITSEYPGGTWYLVRLLITVAFLVLWWGTAGRRLSSAVIGGITLAFIWATYSHFLGPIGLPDTPLRIFNEAPPPAVVQWQDYNQIWLISLPIYIAVMTAIMALFSISERARITRYLLVSLISVAAVAAAVELIVPDKDLAKTATLKAEGSVLVESGQFYSNQFVDAQGTISLIAEDKGGDRVTSLPPHDRLEINANIKVDSHTVEIDVKHPMVEDPYGRHTTWWGVGYDVGHHGKSGIGTSKLPPIKSSIAVFGLGDVSVDGQVVASGVPVHVMTAEKGFPQNMHLEMDVGDEHMKKLSGIPTDHLRVLWKDYEASIPKPDSGKYLLGNLSLLGLLAGGLAINRKER